MYKIEYAPRVKDSMVKYPKHDKKAIYDAIDDLQEEPRPVGVETLKGEWRDYFRIRIGNYRVIYSIDDKILTVYIVKVAKRGLVYKKK